MNIHFPGRVYSTSMDRWDIAVPRLLAASQLGARLTDHSEVLIKPNLVEAIAPPVTTPAALVEQLVLWLREHAPQLTISIGEGTGSLTYPTGHCFNELGYTDLAKRLDVALIDLNHEPLVTRRLPDCSRWPEFHLPALLDRVFLISVPVLKAHSLARVTLTMKNMMGCAPPAHYQQGGGWGKSAFHTRIHQAIFELNRYRCPDFTLLDATIGMSQAHLWGPHCDPPPGLLAAGSDPVAIDSYGCRLLGRSWRDVGHIALADTILGQAEPLEVIEV